VRYLAARATTTSDCVTRFVDCTSRGHTARDLTTSAHNKECGRSAGRPATRRLLCHWFPIAQDALTFGGHVPTLKLSRLASASSLYATGMRCLVATGNGFQGMACAQKQANGRVETCNELEHTYALFVLFIQHWPGCSFTADTNQNHTTDTTCIDSETDFLIFN
jgi:hypothetical protein